MFLRKSILICSGPLADIAGPRVRRFTRATDTWFYRHAEKILAKSSSPVVNFIPVTDFFFRRDRGTFWIGLYAIRQFVTPFNCVTRYVLDHFMHTRVIYHAVHKSKFHKQVYELRRCGALQSSSRFPAICGSVVRTLSDERKPCQPERARPQRIAMVGFLRRHQSRRFQTR